MISDINESMLEEGKKRLLKYNNDVKFLLSDAQKLDKIESNSFDFYSISFGIRNCTDINKVLKKLKARLIAPDLSKLLTNYYRSLPVFNLREADKLLLLYN